MHILLFEMNNFNFFQIQFGSLERNGGGILKKNKDRVKIIEEFQMVHYYKYYIKYNKIYLGEIINQCTTIFVRCLNLSFNFYYKKYITYSLSFDIKRRENVAQGPHFISQLLQFLFVCNVSILLSQRVFLFSFYFNFNFLNGHLSFYFILNVYVVPVGLSK